LLIMSFRLNHRASDVIPRLMLSFIFWHGSLFLHFSRCTDVISHDALRSDARLVNACYHSLL
jgi:hypothetical protein